MAARALFIGGTHSNAGKSWMTTAICAWLRRRGVAVAPFKAQNMSNNSYPCADGGEIGRAQVAQAEACGLAPTTDMNPILLKPGGRGSQVVVNGRMWKTLSPRDYYAHTEELRDVVLAAYARLSRDFEVIIIEGAGSVTELNLREHDLVNLDLVTRLRAPWVLVADIERGGVFASVIGTLALVTPDERALHRGFVINKFRGDPSLFEDGIRILEERTGSRCLGLFPYMSDIHIDPEDSLALDVRARTPAPPGARVAIVRFPHASNTTDFRLLTWADWVSAVPASDYDFIVLPGSKNTIADLMWLRQTGLADWVGAHFARGATVIGICGGYQMLGRTIDDPGGVESDVRRAEGLGLLAASTELTRDKRTRVVAARTPLGVRYGAYEIHLGVTRLESDVEVRPFAHLDDGSADGVWNGRLIGTYLHGAFEHAGVCGEVFGVAPPAVVSKSEHYQRLATWIDDHGRSLGEVALGHNAAALA